MQKKDNIKTKTWLIIIATIFVISIIACFILYQKTGTVAVIERDGVELYRIDLSLVSAAYDIPIESDYGKNTVLVEHGRIRMTDADCPDEVCVNTGWTSTSGIPIVCLPHHLVIRIESDSDKDKNIDAIVQ